MNTDRTTETIVEAWLTDGFNATPDVETMLDGVRAGVAVTPQRRHRWWPVGRTAAAPVPESGPAPARGFTMFSALKFIAASVILALFGSFLMMGVFTMQQSEEVPPAAVTASPTTEATSEPTEAPTTSVRSDILPGVDLTVEAVEPGVFRVIDDGVRDLAKPNDTDIVAGHDGGIYLLRPQRFVRLGSDEWQAWATKKPYVRDFEAAPDGTVWTVQDPPRRRPAAIQSFDGEEWATHQDAPQINVLEVTPDGTVWAFWWDPEQESGQPQAFGYLDEDGWQTLGHLDTQGLELHVAGPDDIWAAVGIGGGNFGAYLARFVDGGWQRWVTMEGTEPTWQPAEEPFESFAWVFPFAVGPDGTFWGVEEGDLLVRLDGSGWSRWPVEGTGFSGAAVMEVATDGSVWYGSGSSADTCGGVVNFDGVTRDRHLSGLCVEAIDINTDGSVWLLATEAGADLRDVYVITPEAVAAKEAEIIEPPTFEEATVAEEAPTATEELLSTMVTEEVEPGVYRVVHDGVRDIASVRYRDVVAGHDGSIWLSGAGSRQDIVRLGSPRDKALKWPDDTEAMGITVTQDGTVWRRYWLTEGGPRLDSLEDGKWTKHHRSIDLDIESLTIAPDGTLWAGPDEGGGLVVSWFGADGWEPLSAPAPTEGELLVTPSGEVWVAGALGGVFSQDAGSWQEESRGRMWRHRWVDGEWQGQEVEMDAMLVSPFTFGLEIGTDGTVWFAGVESLVADGEPVLDADGKPVGDSFLMRFDGTEWQRWGPADGVPSFSAGYGVGLRQAPDGGLWIKASDHIARFDGTEWQRFMSGRHPSHWYLAWDVAPDGSVWLNALDDRDDDTKSDLYVITPEAVAGAE